jgi:inosine-uridine nucleoside N-ribohydrolase
VPIRRVIIDTDPGVDDTAAILFALGSGELDVELVTTVFGNTDVDDCTRNAFTILEAAGRDDIPVVAGVGAPLLREFTGLGKLVHGENGLGDVPLDHSTREATPGWAASEIVRRVMDAPGELELLALGPLTNVALALSIEPRVATALRSLVVMGGTVATPGNVTPVATANFWNDPEAAAIVYRSGAPIVQASLDVARQVYTPHERLEEFFSIGTRSARLLEAVTPFHEDAYRRMGIRAAVERLGVHYNDVPAIAYALRPELFEVVHVFAEVETRGEHSAGQTVIDLMGVRFQPPNVHVCVNAQVDAVVDLFVSSLTSGALG